ncbi:MAG: N-6 DNA methylase [Flavobacteriales bacterium]|nr:N-6 DNA methylase [Flavobacteriales bacterium]
MTDFEEFAIYDTTIRPNAKDKASTARIFYCTYQEYAKHWEYISSIFSKASILKGSFDHFIRDAKKKKGTTAVDKEFLKEMEKWRSDLAKNIALRNTIDIHALNYVVQATIDRILFLRICEDRNIEEYGRLQKVAAANNIYKNLAVFFEQADQKYNSGLFHFHKEKNVSSAPDEISLGLKIDDKILKEIITALYYPSPYEFSVISADILGNVYEQFLGKVIRLTSGGQAKVEEKPEVKKAGGVFYTPQYVVKYIVENTIGDLLKEKTPMMIAGKLKGHSPLRILDPACGSGSFLIYAYQFLLDWHRDWYEKDIRQKGETQAKKWHEAVYQGPGNHWYLTTQEKKRILLKNIFGVDIDHQAVEVTKLNLLLKVLEGENRETLGTNLKLFQERALPDLSQNIKCGNSLIGSDFFVSQGKGQKDLFEIDEDEQYKVNAFDWQAEFSEIFKDAGFDAVIGNPPYVVVSSSSPKDKILEYLRKYPVAQYKLDLFHLFIQKSIDLLRAKDGKLGYIIPNTWLTMQFTDKLRKYILDHTSIKEVVLFEHLVFDEADVHTMLLFLSKGGVPEKNSILIKKPPSTESAAAIREAETSSILQSAWIKNENYVFETRRTGVAGQLAEKILKNSPRLEEVARASLGCQAYNSSKHTPEQIKNRVFHAPKKLTKEYLPELAGSDVARYRISKERGEWIKYGSWLHDYRTLDWLQGPRILIREITGKKPHQIQGCYVEETYCNYKTILNVNPSDKTKFSMKYLTGLLNSALLSFLYPFVSNKIVAQSFPRLSVGDLKKLPIRNIDFNNEEDKHLHDNLTQLVDQMLSLVEKLSGANLTPTQSAQIQRQIDASDREIDKLVYKLYNLTEAEIAVVEGNQRNG